MPALMLAEFSIALRALLSGEVALQGAVLNPGLAARRGSSVHHELCGPLRVQCNALNPRQFCVRSCFSRACVSVSTAGSSRAFYPCLCEACSCAVAAKLLSLWGHRLGAVAVIACRFCCILGPCRPLPLALHACSRAPCCFVALLPTVVVPQRVMQSQDHTKVCLLVVAGR